MVEGLEEQVPATLMVGEGYSFYLPDDEWQQTDGDTWAALVNEQVSFRVVHLDGRTRAQAEEELLGSGYALVNGRIWRCYFPFRVPTFLFFYFRNLNFSQMFHRIDHSFLKID